MTMNLKNLKSLQALIAALAVCSIANAQDSGGDGVPDPIHADVSTESVVLGSAQPLSCEEARRTVWFERELARSDGGSAYLAGEIGCRDGDRIASYDADSID
jgi:hypothetical protein